MRKSVLSSSVFTALAATFALDVALAAEPARAFAQPAANGDGVSVANSDSAPVPGHSAGEDEVVADAVGTASRQAVLSGADTPDATTLEGVQVTGYAGSLVKSMIDKRSAEVISDSISSEDVGKFPEGNIAESLQRITGVQITRNKGEGRFVSVGGLDPKFTAVLYNGRELPPSASGNTRSFDFTVLTADFIRALQVYKSPMASLPEGGVAATIDIQTLRPLDYGKERFVAGVEGIRDDNSKSGASPHLSALYTGTFLDDTLGWSAAADFSQRNFGVHQFQAFGMQPVIGGNLNGGDRYGIQNAVRFDDISGQRERLNFMTMLQYKPNDALEIRLDGLYSRFNEHSVGAQNAMRTVNVGGAINDSVIDASGNVVYYNADRIQLRNIATAIDETDELKSIGLGTTLWLDRWKIDGEVSYAKAEQDFTSLALESIGRANGYYDMRTDPGGIPTIGYNVGFDLMDPEGYNVIGVTGNIDVPASTSTRNAKIAASRGLDVGWLTGIEVGLDYRDQRFSKGSRVLNVSARRIAEALGLPFDATVEGGSFSAAPWMQSFGGSDFLSSYSGPSTIPRAWLASDINLFLDLISLRQLQQISPATKNVIGVSAFEEKVSAAYVKMDFSGWDSRLSGNLGLRFVRTHAKAIGYVPDFNNISYSLQGTVTLVPGTLSPVNRVYTNILPSFNLRYDINEDLVARFGAARVMQRPDLNVLSPATTIDANIRSIRQGNPQVSPYLGNQLNASLEWYFNDQSLLSFAAFYKDVKNFIVSSQHQATYNVNQIQSNTITPVTFFVNQPENGGAVKLKGLEVGYQQPFTFLPGPLKHFGALANFTYIDAGEIPVRRGGPSLPVAGVSEKSYNLGLYYETPSFGAHVLYNYRSDYVSDPVSTFGDGHVVKGYGQLDFTANLIVNDNLSVNFGIVNATNEPIKSVTNYGLGRGWEQVGRRFTLGLQAKF